MPLGQENSRMRNCVGQDRGEAIGEEERCAMSTLEDWMTTVRAELGISGEAVDDVRTVTKVVLDLARDAAHGVARPAAPLTAYLVGVAVGQGAPLPETASRIAALALAQQEPAQQEPAEQESQERSH
jgi:hypothetical protein